MCKRLALILLIGCAWRPRHNKYAHCGNRAKSPGNRYRIHRSVGGSDVGNIPVAVIAVRSPGRLSPWWLAAHGTGMRPSLRSKSLYRNSIPDISGTVIIVRLVNIASFEQKVPHVNPVDGKSMNRFYRGNPNGNADRARIVGDDEAGRGKIRLPD